MENKKYYRNTIAIIGLSVLTIVGIALFIHQTRKVKKLNEKLSTPDEFENQVNEIDVDDVVLPDVVEPDPTLTPNVEFDDNGNPIISSASVPSSSSDYSYSEYSYY